MRNMSFALTTPQAYAQVKTVTRRLGWWNLQPGDLVQQVVKGMGLKKGEKIERIHVIEIVSVLPERLNLIAENSLYGHSETRLEGFPNLFPQEFIEMFCKSHNGCTPEKKVNRICFRYLSEAPKCDKCNSAAWAIDEGDVIRCQLCRREFLIAYPQYSPVKAAK